MPVLITFGIALLAALMLVGVAAANPLCEVCGAPSVASIQSESVSHAYCRDHLAGGYEAQTPEAKAAAAGAGTATMRVLPRAAGAPKGSQTPAPAAAPQASGIGGVSGIGGLSGIGGVNGFAQSGYGSPSVDWVNGYVRRDGTVVNGYYRTRANGVTWDNFSYRSGHYAPYPGRFRGRR